MSEREDRIRAKAHQLWLDEGCPEGRDLEHWRQASEQVDLHGGDASAEPMPAAGPHARPGLTNEAATPGTGMLPEPGSDDPNQQQPSG